MSEQYCVRLKQYIENLSHLDKSQHSSKSQILIFSVNSKLIANLIVVYISYILIYRRGRTIYVRT